MGFYPPDFESGRYDIFQICKNGHAVNSFAQSSPEHNQKFCQRCGAATLMDCPSCHTPIRGHFSSPGVMNLYETDPPGFCHNCGAPYPWTQSRLAAAKEFALEADGLSETDRQLLAGTLDDLVRDTPQTPVAVMRFKRIVAKAGKPLAQGLRDILVDIISETIKKQIWQ